MDDKRGKSAHTAAMVRTPERVKTLAAENDRLRTELTQAACKAEDSAQKVAAAEQKAAVATTKLDGQAELIAIAREQGQQDRLRISELLAEAKDTHERAHAAEETQKQLRHNSMRPTQLPLAKRNSHDPGNRPHIPYDPAAGRT